MIDENERAIYDVSCWVGVVPAGGAGRDRGPVLGEKPR